MIDPACIPLQFSRRTEYGALCKYTPNQPLKGVSGTDYTTSIPVFKLFHNSQSLLSGAPELLIPRVPIPRYPDIKLYQTHLKRFALTSVHYRYTSSTAISTSTGYGLPLSARTSEQLPRGLKLLYKTIKFKFGKVDATTIGDFIDYATTTLKGAGLTLCFSEVDTNSSESKQEHSAAFSAVYTSLEKQEALQDVFKASSTIRAQGQTPKWGDNVVDVTKGIEALMAMFTTDEPAELACDLLKELRQYKPNRRSSFN